MRPPPIASFFMACAYAHALVDARYGYHWKTQKEQEKFSREIRDGFNYMTVAEIHVKAREIAAQHNLRITRVMRDEFPTESCAIVMSVAGHETFLAYNGPSMGQHVLQPHDKPIPAGPFEVLLVEQLRYHDEYPYA